MAAESFKRVIELEPSNFAAFYNLGNVYYALENHQEALKYLEEAVGLDPENTEWKIYTAGIYLEMKNEIGIVKKLFFYI